MKPRIYFLLVFILFPAISFAAEVGFPAQSVWLSDTKPQVGEKIRIYAVVYNGSDAETSGTLTFLVDGKENGSKDVALDSGESAVVASPWTAIAGSHSFSARFSGAGTEAEVKLSETVVAEVEAPPTATEKSIEQAKSVTSQIASTTLPFVSTVAEKVFATTEAIRTAGIAYLEDEPAASSGESSSAVLGTTTVNQVEGFDGNAASASTGAKGIFSTITQTASVGALAIFRSLWLFYPIFVGFLLLIARSLYKWVTKPRF